MVRTYDPKKIVLTVGGFPIGGFADGTFVKISRSEDSFKTSVGADGDTTRVKSTNKSGEIVITLDMSSPSNDILDSMVFQDELVGLGVKPVLIKDLGSASTYATASAWVKKPADVEFGKDVSTREWTLSCADLTMVTGGYLPTV